MRIRQVRPEFFTDPVTGHLPPAVQVTYIGLWCVADDAGWLEWDVPQIGALLYPYKSVRVREGMVSKAGEALTAAARLVIHGCGCANIPTLVDHQRIGGNKAFTVRDKHRVHTSMDKSARNVTLGNVTVGNVTREADASGAASLGERLVAAGIRPELVK
jgi:hypothetical protein